MLGHSPVKNGPFSGRQATPVRECNFSTVPDFRNDVTSARTMGGPRVALPKDPCIRVGPFADCLPKRPEAASVVEAPTTGYVTIFADTSADADGVPAKAKGIDLPRDNSMQPRADNWERH